MQWLLDTQDVRAVAQTRRAIAGEIAPYVSDIHEGFAVEVIAGEILGAEVTNGARRVTVDVQCSLTDVTLQVWDDAPAFDFGAEPLRDALFSHLATTMEIKAVEHGNHLTICLPINRTGDDFARTARIWQLASALVAERAAHVSESLKERFIDAGAGALFDDAPLSQPGVNSIEQPR